MSSTINYIRGSQIRGREHTRAHTLTHSFHQTSISSSLHTNSIYQAIQFATNNKTRMFIHILQYIEPCKIIIPGNEHQRKDNHRYALLKSNTSIFLRLNTNDQAFHSYSRFSVLKIIWGHCILNIMCQ